MEHTNTLSNFVLDYRNVGKSIKNASKKLDELTEEVGNCIGAREYLLKAAQLTQDNLEKHLSVIVTKALEIVFEEEAPKFIVKFVPKRNTSECEMYFSDDGVNEMDPLNSCGFGAADVASFALRVSIWALSKSRPVIIVDEPFRNLDSERMPRASEMVKVLSEELGLQMIIVTHEEDLKEASDKLFVVTKTKEGTIVEEK
jgi:DNA repair exonuclease SbcCD ATPase subunit